MDQLGPFKAAIRDGVIALFLVSQCWRWFDGPGLSTLFGGGIFAGGIFEGGIFAKGIFAIILGLIMLKRGSTAICASILGLIMLERGSTGTSGVCMSIGFLG